MHIHVYAHSVTQSLSFSVPLCHIRTLNRYILCVFERELPVNLGHAWSEHFFSIMVKHWSVTRSKIGMVYKESNNRICVTRAFDN